MLPNPPGSLARQSLAPPAKFRRRSPMSGLLAPIIFVEQLAYASVRKRVDAVVVATCHRLIIDKRVDDRFFGGLHDSGEDLIHAVVGSCLDTMRQWLRIRRAGVRGRKRN